MNGGAGRILVAGGTGRLGSLLVKGFAADGVPVRVLTRNRDAAATLRAGGIDAVVGDLRNPTDLAGAVSGCGTVISAASGFGPMGASTPQSVDRDGNINLIDAAVREGIGHFILVSMHGAASDAALELLRMKHAAEQHLIHSGLPSTIIRPTACLETYLDVIGAPMARNGSTLVFGSGTVPVNFVSAQDTASLIRLVVQGGAEQGVREIEWGGPNLTLNEISAELHACAGVAGKTRRIPLPALRLMSLAARPFSPLMARLARAAVVMNTTDMTFDDGPCRALFPQLPRTGLADAAALR